MPAITVALDTSFLIFLAKRKVSLGRLRERFDSPVAFYTSRGVLNELHALASSDRFSAPHAALALRMLEEMDVKIDPSTEEPDDWLLKQGAIATADIKLARVAHRRGVRIISITKSNRISIR